jgi:hypothetical protein
MEERQDLRNEIKRIVFGGQIDLDHEDGDRKFFRNVSNDLPHYTSRETTTIYAQV